MKFRFTADVEVEATDTTEATTKVIGRLLALAAASTRQGDGFDDGRIGINPVDNDEPQTMMVPE